MVRLGKTRAYEQQAGLQVWVLWASLWRGLWGPLTSQGALLGVLLELAAPLC